MEALHRTIRDQRSHMKRLNRQNAKLITENRRLRAELESYTRHSPAPEPVTARQFSVPPPSSAAVPSNDDSTPTDDFDERVQARPWCKPPVPWYPENHLTREHRKYGHPGYQGIERRNTETNYSGRVCNPCEKDGSHCNGMGPCNRCIDTHDVCWYFPCGYGMFCTNDKCGRLHAGQANPWDSDPGLPTLFGNGFDDYMKQLHSFVRENQRDDFADHRHRTTVGGTEERPIVID